MDNNANLLPAQFLSPGLSLGQLLAILRAHLRVIALCGLAMTVFAVLVSKLVLKKSYDATATVLVNYEVNSPDTNREFPSMLAASYMTTQTAYINSAAVLGPVVDELGWAGNAEKTKGYSGPAAGLRDYLINKVLGKGLSVDNPRDNRLIYIRFTADSPEEAARVANAVADSYVKAHGESLREPAKQRAAEYLKSVDELKDRFVKAQTAVAEFRQRTGLVDMTGKGNIEEERMREIDSALLLAEADSRNASIRRSQVARLSGRSGDADVEYAASPGVVRIRGDLLTAEQRFTELQKTLGPRHPDYLAAEAQVRELRAKLSNEVAGFSGGLINNAGTAAGQSAGLVSSLRSRLQAEKDRLLAIRGQQDEAARLLSEQDAAEKVYKLALDEYGKIIRNAETQYNDVSLVSRAVPPAKHTKPKTTVNLLLGLLGGLLAGALAALVWEFTHRRVRSIEDIEREFGEAPLAIIGGASR